MSDSFIQSDLLVPNYFIMYLSLSKSVVTGIKEHEFKGEKPPGATLVMDQKMVQDTMQSMLLREAKPVIRVSHQGKCLTLPLDTSTDVCVLGVGSKNESYTLTKVPKKEPHHKLSHEPPHKWKPKSEQWIVLMVRFILDQHVLNISMTRLMHLSCPKECETGLENQREYTAQRKNTSTMMFSVADQKLGQRDAEPLPYKFSLRKVKFL